MVGTVAAGSGWGNVLLELMPDTVSIRVVTGYDESGARTYSASTSYPARVTTSLERVVDWHSQETVDASAIWVAPNSDGLLPDCGTDMEVTLPNGLKPPVFRAETFSDDKGIHHCKIHVRRGERPIGF